MPSWPRLPRHHARCAPSFCGELGVTECQTSDALALTAQQVDLPGRVIVPMRWRLQQGVRGEHPVVGLAELRQL